MGWAGLKRASERLVVGERQGHGGGMASSQGKNELRFADWMAALPDSIHGTPLTNLAIPGKGCPEGPLPLSCPRGWWGRWTRDAVARRRLAPRPGHRGVWASEPG